MLVRIGLQQDFIAFLWNFIRKGLQQAYKLTMNLPKLIEQYSLHTDKKNGRILFI